ncbi:MAG: MarR family transcriptional regulator [Candidatus Nanohaloarchaea archaeon]
MAQVAQQSLESYSAVVEMGDEEPDTDDYDQLGRQERRVLAAVTHHGPLTRQQIADEYVEFKESTVCARVRRLMQKGLLEEVYRKHVTLEDGRRVRRGVLDVPDEPGVTRQ